VNRHVSEKDLIRFQFDLAGADQAEKVRRHLEGCADCRRQAQRLKLRFAALDLLRREAPVPDELVASTLERASREVRSRFILFRGPVLGAAAAAAVLIALLPAASELLRKTTHPRPTGQSPLGEIADAPAEGKPPASGVDVAAAKTPPDEAGTADIRERPPFAPASAIELVTLPRRDNVQLTIYNSADLTLVRERRNLTLKRGWNWLQFMWANTLIDPTSLHLEPLAHADKIDVRQLVFPAGLKDVGRWLIRSEVSGQVPFEITYFTSGLSWRAFYMGTLAADERRMRLQGYVRVGNNSGEDYDCAQTRLIVGKVHQLDRIAELARRRYPYNRPGQAVLREAGGIEEEQLFDSYNGRARDFARDNLGALAPKEIRKEGLSEYFLYTIEGTETIPEGWGKRLISFDVDDIAVKSLYKYDEQRWGKRAIRFVSFANDEEHNLGETPIPNGTVRIYRQTGAGGHLSYIGAADVKYIPVGEEVELNLGPARLVSIEPALMEFRVANYLFDGKDNVAGWDEGRSWKVKMTNTRRLPAEIEITRGFKSAYWTLRLDDGHGVSYTKHDATHARFRTELPPRSTRTFTYTVTTYHGTRREAVAR